MIERLFESAVMSAVATDEYAYWRLIVEAGVLFSSGELCKIYLMQFEMDEQLRIS